MTIEKYILAAIEKLKVNDSVLIDKKMERPAAHRLAVYLEEYFPGWNIDCEYNKMGEKTQPKQNSCGNHKRPDIIIHKRERNEKENNLLVIEIKIEHNGVNDTNKLIDFTSEPSPSRTFQYQKGLQITFLPSLDLKWFIGGKQKPTD